MVSQIDIYKLPLLIIPIGRQFGCFSVDEKIIVHSFKMLKHIPLALLAFFSRQCVADSWSAWSDPAPTFTKTVTNTRVTCPCDGSETTLWSAWETDSTDDDAAAHTGGSWDAWSSAAATTTSTSTLTVSLV